MAGVLQGRLPAVRGRADRGGEAGARTVGPELVPSPSPSRNPSPSPSPSRNPNPNPNPNPSGTRDGLMGLRVGSSRLSRRERRTSRASSEDGSVTPPAPGGGMTTETTRPGAQTFVAFEIAIAIIVSLRDVVARIRRHNSRIADQIVESASSCAANLAEGNRRVGKDRLHFFRIAAGSADETRAHLRVAMGWGWVTDNEVEHSLKLIDRELALTWKLTH